MVDATVAGLLEQANARFTAADEALRAGDLGKYQQELDAAKALVRQAVRRRPGGSRTAHHRRGPTDDHRHGLVVTWVLRRGVEQSGSSSGS